MMMDVEKVLSETTNYDEDSVYSTIQPIDKTDLDILRTTPLWHENRSFERLKP